MTITGRVKIAFGKESICAYKRPEQLEAFRKKPEIEASAIARVKTSSIPDDPMHNDGLQGVTLLFDLAEIKEPLTALQVNTLRIFVGDALVRKVLSSIEDLVPTLPRRGEKGIRS